MNEDGPLGWEHWSKIPSIAQVLESSKKAKKMHPTDCLCTPCLKAQALKFVPPPPAGPSVKYNYQKDAWEVVGTGGKTKAYYTPEWLKEKFGEVPANLQVSGGKVVAIFPSGKIEVLPDFSEKSWAKAEKPVGNYSQVALSADQNYIVLQCTACGVLVMDAHKHTKWHNEWDSSSHVGPPGPPGLIGMTGAKGPKGDPADPQELEALTEELKDTTARLDKLIAVLEALGIEVPE